MYGSVRGAARKGRPYRDRGIRQAVKWQSEPQMPCFSFGGSNTEVIFPTILKGSPFSQCDVFRGVTPGNVVVRSRYETTQLTLRVEHPRIRRKYQGAGVFDEQAGPKPIKDA